MTGKSSRILILDSVHAQSMQLEKMLNAMGYYCIATTASLEEGVKLSLAGVKRFDLLLAAEPISRQHTCQLTAFEEFEINNIFVYSCPLDGLERKWSVKGEGCFRNGMPEYSELEQFMIGLAPGNGNSRHTTRDWRLTCRDEY